MKKRLVSVVLYIVFIGSIAAAVMYYFYFYRNQEKGRELFTQMEQEVDKQQEELHKAAKAQIEKKTAKESSKNQNKQEKQENNEKARVSKPKTYLNLPELKKTNQDVYGWIEIPGTNINYPILQNQKDDYYLMHNINHSTGYPGCIYSNVVNSKTFSDTMTVLYGHNMKNETMFGSLYHFREKFYFKKNPYIYIYTEHEVAVYEIMSVREWTNENILEQYNPDSYEDRTKFLSNILTENSIQYRKMEIEEDSKVLILSTCIRGKSDKRLLIVGVQI